MGTGGGHWKGVNVSLRENRIGHGADADLKRGTYALRKLSEVLWLLGFLLIRSKLGMDTEFIDRGR